MLLVNGMNPGPEIRANVGDVVSITIINMSPETAFTIHYHGIKMFHQPYADGTNSRTQCNISPMQVRMNSMLICFDHCGTFFIH